VGVVRRQFEKRSTVPRKRWHEKVFHRSATVEEVKFNDRRESFRKGGAYISNVPVDVEGWGEQGRGAAPLTMYLHAVSH